MAPIIKHLLHSAAKIDVVKAWNGQTALHEAVMYRNYGAIETLIAAGANAKVRDKVGKTPPSLTFHSLCMYSVR